MDDTPTYPYSLTPSRHITTSDEDDGGLPISHDHPSSYGIEITDSIIADSGSTQSGQSSTSEQSPQSPRAVIFRKRAFREFMQEQEKSKDTEREMLFYYKSAAGSTIAEPGSPQSLSSGPSDVVENLRDEFQNVLGEDGRADGEGLDVCSCTPPSLAVEDGSRSPRATAETTQPQLQGGEDFVDTR
jgi:hypothetical protein